MNTNEMIGIIAAALIISGFIAFVWMGIKDDFRKGGDFTMKNPPEPPKREKELEDMTYSELHEEFKRGKSRLERISELMKQFEKSIGVWRISNDEKYK